MKGSPETRQGDAAVAPFVKQHKQYSQCLLVGGRINLDLAY